MGFLDGMGVIIFRSAVLIASQAFSGVFLILLTSRRLESIPESAASGLVQIIQWQGLCLTVAKFGIDLVVFAAVSENPEVRFDPLNHLIRKAIPVAIVFSILLGVVVSPWIGAAILLTVPLDVWCIMSIADLNARRHIVLSALAALFNYPVLFCGMILMAKANCTSVVAICLAFTIASATRFLFIQVVTRTTRQMGSLRNVDSRVDYWMAVQQSLNFFLYRADILLVGLIEPRNLPSIEVQHIVFLSRCPELFATLCTTIAPAVLPVLVISADKARRSAHLPSVKPLLYSNCLLCLLIIPSVYAYCLIWKGPGIPVRSAVAYGLQAALVLPVYVCSYSMLKSGFIKGLVSKLGFSAGSGMILGLILLAMGVQATRVLPWIVVVQLASFLVLVILYSWGGTSGLHTADQPVHD